LEQHQNYEYVTLELFRCIICVMVINQNLLLITVVAGTNCITPIETPRSDTSR
jgi:hypothetical protein